MQKLIANHSDKKCLCRKLLQNQKTNYSPIIASAIALRLFTTAFRPINQFTVSNVFNYLRVSCSQTISKLSFSVVAVVFRNKLGLSYQMEVFQIAFHTKKNSFCGVMGSQGDCVHGPQELLFTPRIFSYLRSIFGDPYY